MPNLPRPLLLLLTALSLALAGCDASDAPAPADQPASPPAAQGPVPGGRIILGALGDASNLLWPLSSDSTSHEIADYFSVAPLKYDKDLNIVPLAAKSFQALDGGTRLRFTLRDDIRWDDGVPLTARDVEFTYKLMVDPKTPTAYAEDFMAIKEFRLLGDYEFEAVYEQPFARALITWMHGILPRHKLEGQDLTTTDQARNPLSAGPYRLKQWDSGSTITLEARDDYFEGRPYIDQVVYRIIPDLATMFLELKSGNLDMMGLTPQQYLHQTRGAEWDANYQKFRYLAFGYTFLGYNLKSPFFADPAVRRALAHAIDKDELIKGVLLGQGVPTIGPYKPGTWVHNDAIADYPYDPAKAKALLAEAGWSDHDGDGSLDKDGRAFDFTILTNQGNDLRIKTATIIQERLAAIGVRVRIRTVEWAAFLKEFVDKGNFDALIMGWNILQDPDIYDVWHSSKAMPGELNFIGYANPEADAMLEQARHTLDQPQRKKLYDRLQEILHHDQPYCFLYVSYALPIVHARVKGIEPAPSGLTHNFIRWWIPADQQRYQPQP